MALDRRAYSFFHENGGWIVGQRALLAAALARAEQEALSRDWEAEWVWDDCHDRGPEDWGWSEKECKRFWETEHEVLGCILKDAQGNTLASLWGIWDPSASYRRVVEAELAIEALDTWERERARTATATLWTPDTPYREVLK